MAQRMNIPCLSQSGREDFQSLESLNKWISPYEEDDKNFAVLVPETFVSQTRIQHTGQSDQDDQEDQEDQDPRDKRARISTPVFAPMVLLHPESRKRFARSSERYQPENKDSTPTARTSMRRKPKEGRKSVSLALIHRRVGKRSEWKSISGSQRSGSQRSGRESKSKMQKSLPNLKSGPKKLLKTALKKRNDFVFPEDQANEHSFPVPPHTWTARQVGEYYQYPLPSQQYSTTSPITIGIISLGGSFNKMDIDHYVQTVCQHTGQSPSITVIPVDDATPAFDYGAFDIQNAVDIQTVAGIYPECNLVIYVAANSCLGYLNALNTAVYDEVNSPCVITMNYSITETELDYTFLVAFNNTCRIGVQKTVGSTSAQQVGILGPITDVSR